MSPKISRSLAAALMGLFLLLLLPAIACSDSDFEEDPDEPVEQSATATKDAAPDGGQGLAGPTSFESAACPIDVDESIECGYLLVPEDRSNPQGRQVRLPVAIIPALNGDPLPDPIVFLSGGPGEIGLTDPEGWWDMPFANERDIIIFDQRGTGHAEPSLDCPEMDDYDYEYDGALACHDRLQSEGIDLAQYNSAASAADLNDLRLALGYDEWNLLGISYGTRLALTVMRDFPEGLRSVLLDSTYPPQVNAYTSQPLNTIQAFEALFAGCAADFDCNDWYPELDQVFYELVADLNDNPIDLDGQPLSGDDLVAGLFGAMYDTETIPILPLAIYDAYEGYYETLYDVLGEGGGFQSDEESLADSEGAYYSVECHEEVPFADLDEAEALLANYPDDITASLLGEVDNLIAICQAWGAGSGGAIEAEPVRSAIPTLIFAGQFDPITPPAWGQAATGYLNQAYFFVFPGFGHDVIDADSCPQEIAAEFFADPFREPDSSCIDEIGGPYFELP